MVFASDTDRRRLEEQFRQAPKIDEAGALFSGIADDLNNLLTVINGYSELLLARLDRDDRNRPVVGEVHRAGARAAELTHRLQLLNRSDADAPPELDINAQVRELEPLLRRTVGTGIELSTTLSATRPVCIHAGPVDQVLLHLVVNARDAMPHGGRLSIETRDVDLDAACPCAQSGPARGRHVLLAVSDTGSGMAPEVLAQLCEPFLTANQAGTGTRRGLATAYGIVRRSGGHIGAHSQPGGGTTFKVYLPCAGSATRRGVTMTVEQPARHRRETVLLVEDEGAVRGLLRHLLQVEGYRVLDAPGGPEALEAAQQEPGPIDLLITDVVMPIIGGQELAERMCQRYPGMRVLFVSGYTDEAIVRHGTLENRVYFLQKPFVASLLLQTVRDVLEAPKR